MPEQQVVDQNLQETPEQKAEREAAEKAAAEQQQQTQETPEQKEARETAEKAEKEKKDKEEAEHRKEQARSRLQRERDEARAQAKAAQELLERMTASQQQSQQQTGEPKREQFNTDLEYFNAVRTYDRNIIRQELGSQIQQVQSQKQSNDFQQKVSEAKKEYSDFEDVTFDVMNRNMPNAIEAIMTSPISGHIVYELGKNPELTDAIANMTPTQAAREIGKIEARIEANKKQASSRETKAPPPIKPVGTRATEQPKTPQNMTDAEYIAWRRDHKYRGK